MQFAKTILAIVAVTSSALAIDWTAPETLKCSKENWAAIKAAADPLIPMAPLILTPEQKVVFESIMNGAT
ncbi:hypothetical protein LPJ77_005016, partial [Coemansia sp. RSA 2523]